jgi:hypothetical protein
MHEIKSYRKYNFISNLIFEGPYKVLAGKPEKKRPLGRPRRRRKNIKIGLKETKSKGVD